MKSLAAHKKIDLSSCLNIRSATMSADKEGFKSHHLVKRPQRMTRVYLVREQKFRIVKYGFWRKDIRRQKRGQLQNKLRIFVLMQADATSKFKSEIYGKETHRHFIFH